MIFFDGDGSAVRPHPHARYRKTLSTEVPTNPKATSHADESRANPRRC
jgi:hypothetical protein